jgi:hypothetical protein
VLSIGQPKVLLRNRSALRLTMKSCAAVNWPMRNLMLLVKSCSIHRLNSRIVGGASTPLTSIRLSRLAALNCVPKMPCTLA